MANEDPGNASFWRYNAHGPTPIIVARPKAGQTNPGGASYWRYNTHGQRSFILSMDPPAAPGGGTTSNFFTLLGVGS